MSFSKTHYLIPADTQKTILLDGVAPDWTRGIALRARRQLTYDTSGTSTKLDKRVYWNLVLLLLVTSVLSACVSMRDPEASQGYRSDTVATIGPDQIVEQTFISRRARLNAIELWLYLGEGASIENGSLFFELFRENDLYTPITRFTISFRTIADNSSIQIPVPILNEPPNQAYRLRLTSADGPAKALGRNEDAYPTGQLFINDKPYNADLSFQLSYDYGFRAVFDDISKLISKAWLFFPLALVLWIPGRILLYLSTRGSADRFDWGERNALSIGLSLAVIPLTLLWTTTFGLHWNPWMVWVVCLALIIAWLYCARHDFSALSSNLGSGVIIVDKYAVALGAVFLFSLFIREAMVRDLSAPAWVDSVHHATITRLILDSGAFPSSYEPYVQTASASYHSGYHSVLAAFLCVSGLEIHDGMQVLGQVLNALMVFSVYLFTKTFTGDRTAGMFAAMIAGVFSPMPAYYASWGRFTHLTGLLILPVAFTFVVHFYKGINEARQRSYPKVIEWEAVFIPFACVACAGLFLTHYQVTLFLGLLLFSGLITSFFRYIWIRRLRWRFLAEVFSLLVVILFSILIVLPWLVPAMAKLIVPFSVGFGQGSGVAANFFAGFPWDLLTTGYGRHVTILAAVGLIWAILQRKWFGLPIAAWIALLFLSANMRLLGIPRLGFVNKLSVIITLFLPLSLFAGYLISRLTKFVNQKVSGCWRFMFQTSMFVTGIVLAVFGARSLLPLLNPVTFLFKSADYPALVWMRENIEDGEVLITPFLWGYGLYAGSDGGYWITPLTGLRTLPPPLLYWMSEPEYRKEVRADCQMVLDIHDDPEALYHFMIDREIQFLYLGARGGVFSYRNFQYSPYFTTLYSEDGVWIFEVVP